MPRSALFNKGADVTISTCASTLWWYCTAANFPDMVPAWFPSDSKHHAAKSIKAYTISVGGDSALKNFS